MSGSKFSNGKSLTPSKRRFEKWLLDLGYQSANEAAPGAVLAEDLVQDFIDENPDLRRDWNSINKHASQIGYISDCYYEDDDYDDDESSEDGEYYQSWDE